MASDSSFESSTADTISRNLPDQLEQQKLQHKRQERHSVALQRTSARPTLIEGDAQRPPQSNNVVRSPPDQSAAFSIVINDAVLRLFGAGMTQAAFDSRYRKRPRPIDKLPLVRKRKAEEDIASPRSTSEMILSAEYVVDDDDDDEEDESKLVIPHPQSLNRLEIVKCSVNSNSDWPADMRARRNRLDLPARNSRREQLVGAAPVPRAGKSVRSNKWVVPDDEETEDEEAIDIRLSPKVSVMPWHRPRTVDMTLDQSRPKRPQKYGSRKSRSTYAAFAKLGG